MPQAFFHREQHIRVAAGLDIDHAVRMKTREVKRRFEQVTPAQAPEDGSLHARQNPCKENGRARIIRQIGAARHFVERTCCNAAAWQSLIQFVDAEWDRVVADAYALDTRNARSQIFKDGGLAHGIQETRG